MSDRLTTLTRMRSISVPCLHGFMGVLRKVIPPRTACEMLDVYSSVKIHASFTEQDVGGVQ